MVHRSIEFKPTLRGAFPSRSGLSLLEVVLALSILAMATAYLSQAMNIATTNALRAERLTQSELVAESVMNQVIAGVIPSQPVSWTQYISANQQSMGTTSRWMYQLQSVQTEMEGMLGIQIAVQEVSQDGLTRNDYDFFVNRWIIDPELGLDTPPEETEEEAASSDGSSSSSSGSDSTSTGA
jgi:general secretion pathway protein I